MIHIFGRNMYVYVSPYIYVCIIIRDNVTYEGFAYWIIYRQNTNIKHSCGTLCLSFMYIYIYIYIYIYGDIYT